jgi:uncharacterized Zn-binding protein involved in type VI secretion
VTRRQPALLSEVALEPWATPLRPPSRTSLRRFKRQTQEVSASELLAAIAAHLEFVEEAQRSRRRCLTLRTEPRRMGFPQGCLLEQVSRTRHEESRTRPRFGLDGCALSPVVQNIQGNRMGLQGRVGDIAACPADSHGCKACAHSVSGPATAGSPNVIVNGMPALRKGDPGVHSACCGPNTWLANGGAAAVLINGQPAYRTGDPSKHCGGGGTLITGSPNVIVGDEPFVSSVPLEPYDGYFVVHYETTNTPCAGIRYRITLSNGGTVEGVTDEQGRTTLVTTEGTQALSLDVLANDADLIELSELAEEI